MTVNGLPLHPLVVHATVVALPVFALVALGYVNPRWRRRLRWPLFALAVVAAVLIFVTSSSGDSLKHSIGPVGGVLGQRIHRHEQLAGYLQVATYIEAGLAAVITLGEAYLGKVRWLQWLALALIAVGAVVVVILTVMTGDAGARAAWGSV